MKVPIRIANAARRKLWGEWPDWLTARRILPTSIKGSIELRNGAAHAFDAVLKDVDDNGEAEYVAHFPHSWVHNNLIPPKAVNFEMMPARSSIAFAFDLDD